jgi:hypothetical protein
MSYITIGTALYNKINGIKAAAGIAVVYGQNEKSLAQYPAVTISAQGHESNFSDTAANMRIYTFMVRLFVRLEVDSTAETQIRTVLDSIVTSLEGDTTLSGACDWTEPADVTISEQNVEIPVKMCDMTVKCYKRVVVR